MRWASRAGEAALSFPRRAFDGPTVRGRKGTDCSGAKAAMGGISGKPFGGIDRLRDGSAFLLPIITVPGSYLHLRGTWRESARSRVSRRTVPSTK